MVPRHVHESTHLPEEFAGHRLAVSFPHVVVRSTRQNVSHRSDRLRWWGTNILREAAASGRCRIAALVDVDRRQARQMRRRGRQWTNDTPKHLRTIAKCWQPRSPTSPSSRRGPLARPADDRRPSRPGPTSTWKSHRPHGHGGPRDGQRRPRRRPCRAGRHARRISRTTSRAGSSCVKAAPARSGWSSASCCTAVAGRSSPQEHQAAKELNWDLWCGPPPYGRSTAAHIRAGSAATSTTPTGRSATGASTGSTKSCGIMDEKWPKTVHSTGGRSDQGRPILTDELQTTDAPDHQVATYQFEDFTLTWEHRQFAGNRRTGRRVSAATSTAPKGRSTWAGREAGVLSERSGRAGEVHEEPQLNLPDQQNIKGLWTDFLSAIETGRRRVRHRGDPLLDEPEPAGDAVVQARTQRHLGRGKGSLRRRSRRQQTAPPRLPSPWVYPKA
jgi:hypothetical protein